MKILFLLLFFKFSLSLNILALFPYPGGSHFKFFAPILRGLSTKGHNLTVVSHFPQKINENYTDIVLKNEVLFEFIKFEQISSPKFMYYYGIYLINDLVDISCRSLGSNSVQNLIKNHNFDVILVETFVSDCYLALAYKMKIPFIGLSSSGYLPWILNSMGNPLNPSYIPQIFAPFSDKMTFFERLENTFIYMYYLYQYDRLVLNRNNFWAKKFFGKDMPDLREISKNISLWFVNNHFSLNLPRPIVPSIIEIGGISVQTKKNLDQNLEKWINESDAGVVYFSMGSMIKGHSFPPEIRDVFVRAFSRLPQRILWKWENDTLPGKTDNIMIQKWMPQFDILCHPNVKGYISHGGLLGTTEAVHCGVPAVVLPQYGDQFVNAAALQAGGGGIVLDFKTATEDDIYEAITKILSPSFQGQASKLSAIFRDRPMSPLDTAVYWVEYVARHGGSHMRSAAVGMPWYQYLLLDVTAFLVAILLTSLALTYLFLKTIWRALFKSQEPKKKTE